MRPRTQYQKKVAALNEQLPCISESVKKWAKKSVAEYFAYSTTKDYCTCMVCGQSWTESGEQVTCPSCGSKMKKNYTTKRTHEEAYYFSTFTTKGGLQVQRMFRYDMTSKRGHAATHTFREVGRYWTNEQGETEITARPRYYGGYYLDAYNYNAPMALRNDNAIYHYVADCIVYPRSIFAPYIKEKGVKQIPSCVNPHLLVQGLITDPRIETIWKAGRYEHAQFFFGRPFDLKKYWNSYKIAMRHHYEITDISMWCDTLLSLDTLGKDIRSPHYICPSDLKAAHDYWQKKIQAEREKRERERERIELENKRKRAILDEENYQKAKARFFGLVITDGKITISVLKSVDDFFKEGKAMHHCVAACAYYTKEDSLILSARINGERVETIEVSLKTFTIVQSRGVCNKNTPYHDEIVNLVNKNMNLIRKAA